MNSVYVYDPQADAWTQLASMSTGQWKQASAAVGGKLYVFGAGGWGLGVGADTERVGTVEVYDPASDSWAQVSSLPSVRSSMVVVAL